MAVARAPGELVVRRHLPTDRAARIVEAMRVCVARLGTAGATFDHVAREAGVSRGLLHYYFGTKERLLVEVVRRECDLRIEALKQAIDQAGSAEAVLAALVRSFEDFLGDAQTTAVMFYEIMLLGQRGDEIAIELAELARRTRTHLAEALRAKSEAGVLELRSDPMVVSAFLFAIADGITMRRLSEPRFDIGPLIAEGVAATRSLLG